VGQEIFYCSGCRTQLRSADFEKGKAYKLPGLDALCAKCVPEALQSLAPEKLQALQKAMAAAPKRGTERVPLATSTPKAGTGRIPLAATPSSTRRIPVVGEEKNLKPVILVAVLIAIAILGALTAMVGRKTPETGARAPIPSPPDLPIPSPAPETARDGTAKETLRKAHLYADTHPTEFLEQLRLFQLAAEDAKGTGYEKDVNKALEGVRRRSQEAASAELRILDERSRDACAKDEFKRATELLEAARRKPVSPEWSGEIDRRIQEVQARLGSAYGRIRAQALAAKPASDELRALRERVARWGDERLTVDLDKALADAAAPKPAPVPAPAPAPPDAPKLPSAAEAEVFARSWSDILMAACGRDFVPAIQELERISPALQDPILKSQATADLEILRGVAALHAEAMQTIAKWPPGKKISLHFIDYDGNPQHVEGPLARVRNGTLEVNKGKPIPQWPLGHLTARSLVDFAPGRNRVIAAIACLIEGDTAGAKELAGESNAAIPARYWKWAAEASKPADKELQERERKVRYDYYWAALIQGAPTLRAEAALKCRRILEETPSMTWVRRNRAMLTAVADTTREYVAGPAALRQTGMFRLEVPKTLPYWMCSMDIDPAKRKENYVEMEFSVLSDATYHAWAYIGACCSESLVFYSQTTDLAGAEPGSEPDAPVKHAMTSATKNHAGHGNRKGPVKWGWVELPLPKYDKPGAKILRLLTEKQGFSVAWIAVSSLRDRPPGDSDSREWEKEIVHNAGPLGPTISLAAWFKADAGTAVEAGHVAQWQDQSGHGRHAIQVAPTARPTLVANAINGKPALRFDGAANALSFDCPVNGLTSMTLFIVAGASKNQRGNELGNYAALEWQEFGPWGNIFLSPQQTCVAWRCGTGQFGNLSLWERPDTSPKGPSLTTLRKDGSKEELFVQGALALATKDKFLSIAHTQDVATIGAGTDARQNPLRYYGGDIAEILVFTRALTEFERDAIERYLRGKYGI
jgi:hypothetical protein